MGETLLLYGVKPYRSAAGISLWYDKGTAGKNLNLCYIELIFELGKG